MKYSAALPMFLIWLENCLVPRRLSLNDDVRAKEGGEEKYPSHGPLRVITSCSPLPCEKRSGRGEGWLENVLSYDNMHAQEVKGM